MDLFNEKLLEKGNKLGCMEMGSNTVMINNANVSLRNIIDNYGRLTVSDIKNHTMNYIGKHTKKEQQSSE